MGWDDRCEVSELIGKTLTEVRNISDEEIRFVTVEGGEYRMFHSQDCCESVNIEDVCGDLSDLTDSPIIQAEEVSNADGPAKNDWDESHTWTFYKIATNKGGVTIRWYGTSNGYYSESVDFERVVEG
jgi:hypothetical protein